jgi:uncharacterized membrane protein
MKRSNYYVAVILIIVISIFLRFFLLDNQSLWYDEGVSLILSDKTSVKENLSRILSRNGSDKYQSLYYLILFYWRSAFGNTEFAIRSLSAILGVSSVITIFFTTLRIYGKNHAIWSSLILGFSSFGVYYSQEARPYSLLIFLASLQLYFFSQWFKQDDNKIIWRLSFAIVTAIGAWGSILLVLFSVALCLSHAIIDRKLKPWLEWWLPTGVLSAPIILILLYLSSPAVAEPTEFTVTRTGFPIIQNVIFVIYGILVGTTYGPSQEQLRGDGKIQVVLDYLPQLTLLLIVGTVIFIALVKTLWRQGNRSKCHRADYLFACLFVTSFFLGLILALFTGMNWLPRHAFYLCVSLAILIPSAFSHRHKHRVKLDRLSRYAQMAVTFLIILNIYSLFNYYFNENYWRDDYRSAVEYLLKNRESSAKSILLGLAGNTRLLEYYGDPLTLDGKTLGDEWKEGKLAGQWAEQVEDFTNKADTVFLVVNREHYFPKGSIEREMSDLYTLQSKVHFPYFNIYRFTRN